MDQQLILLITGAIITIILFILIALRIKQNWTTDTLYSDEQLSNIKQNKYVVSKEVLPFTAKDYLEHAKKEYKPGDIITHKLDKKKYLILEVIKKNKLFGIKTKTYIVKNKDHKLLLFEKIEILENE